MSYSYRIEQAIKAASVLHADQVRKGSTPFPYITHLFAVAMIVADYTDDENVIIAALLHDTLEDTDYTADELKDDFGGTVTDIVLSLTQLNPHETDTKSWKEAKKEYAKQLKNASQGALIVSAADKIHNMRSIVEEYFERESEFIADFGSALTTRLAAYQDISNILNRRLKNNILEEFNNVFKEYKNYLAHVEKKHQDF